MSRESEPYVVVDWGTSHFRAYHINAAGTIQDRCETADGIHTLGGSGFADVLRERISPWREPNTALVVYACGMITSANGWIELPYVPCPAGAAEIAACVHRKTLDDYLSVLLVPGVNDPHAKPFADVMRGEETQVLGAGVDNGQVVLPGTHSKWVTLADRRIEEVRTAVTGELYALLRQHSFFAAGDTPTTLHEESFLRGLATAKLARNALLQQLFSVRTGVLSGELQSTHTGDYLSGLLIGQEIQQCAADAEILTLVGNEALCERYLLAAQRMGIQAVAGPADAVVSGIAALRQFFLRQETR